MNNELVFASASELAELIRERELSPLELVEGLLCRIKQLNPELSAYLTVAEEESRSTAAKAEEAITRREALSHLQGIPVSIKDLHFTKGLRTTGGSLIFRDFTPREDCIAVERLRRAGAIILGKTNTPEFGLSATTENRLGDHCRNPWDLTRTSGGSSGGAAAAVAAGLGPLALGSDVGGSIRIPAGFCGVFGFKPSFGRVPLYRGFTRTPLFAHIGPITRTVLDAAFMLEVMSGFDPRDPNSLRDKPPDFTSALKGGLPRLSLAWSPNLGYAQVDPEVRQIVEACLRIFESLGFEIEEATPEIEPPFPIFDTITLADLYAAFGYLLEDHADELMPYVKSILEHGRDIPGHRYSEALRRLERFRLHMATFFDKYDLLATPTNAVPAFPVGKRPKVIDGKEVNTIYGPFPFTLPFNLTGQPAASIPCGFSREGLPIGLQIATRFGEDALLLRVAAAFERAKPWKDFVPPVAPK